MNSAEPAPPARVEYGRFGSRMIASTMDIGILLLVALPLVQVIMAYLFRPIDADSVVNALNAPNLKNNYNLLFATFWRLILQQHILQRALVQNLLQIAFIAVYVLPFWFRFSATPGKMLLGLRIRDATTGEPMTNRQCILRFVGYIISGAPFSLGFVWILLNRKRRGFHDFIAHTVVTVKPRKYNFL